MILGADCWTPPSENSIPQCPTAQVCTAVKGAYISGTACKGACVQVKATVEQILSMLDYTSEQRAKTADKIYIVEATLIDYRIRAYGLIYGKIRSDSGNTLIVAFQPAGCYTTRAENELANARKLNFMTQVYFWTGIPDGSAPNEWIDVKPIKVRLIGSVTFLNEPGETEAGANGIFLAPVIFSELAGTRADTGVAPTGPQRQFPGNEEMVAPKSGASASAPAHP
jgi:hypothetical protein